MEEGSTLWILCEPAHRVQKSQGGPFTNIMTASKVEALSLIIIKLS